MQGKKYAESLIHVDSHAKFGFPHAAPFAQICILIQCSIPKTNPMNARGRVEEKYFLGTHRLFPRP